MKLFDSHAHYWDQRFDDETENGVDDLLTNLFRETVGGIVNVGTNLETTMLSVRQAQTYPFMYAAGGIHPGDISDMDSLDALEKIWTPLFQNPLNKLVALGEIGLDYHYTPFDKARQMAFFEAQMALAEKLSLPVIIHDREAHGDCFDMVRKFPNVRGVFHSYSGSAEMAKALVSRGYYISFSGTVSFKNARNVKEAASAVPKEFILIETDAPYLAPHPYRGRLNHSGYLLHTAEAIAQIWQTSLDEVAEITEKNAKAFFNL
ncbi:MAG: TatD family deoxyribonuclease [Ruminococcaceae bacterium]|nr:TatD family deoxyribonuclease [Oscillospiraceae bacterium]